MSHRSPLRTLDDPCAAPDPEAVLAAIDRTLADPELSAAVRTVLAEARDALVHSVEHAAAAHQRYQAVFDAVPDPVSIIGWDGTVLDLNRAGLNAYRRARSDIVGRPIHVLNPDLPRDHMAPVWDALGRGGSYVVEVSNMRGDGTRFPVEVHSAAFNQDGEKLIVAVARDLSGRRDAETRHRELMETIDKGILVRGADGRIIHANAAAMRLFGVAPDEPIDSILSDEHWLVIDEHGRALDDSERPAMRALRLGEQVESTVLGFYHREQRRLVWLSVTAVPQFAPGSDQVQQVLSLFSDVTALKRDSALFDRAQTLAQIGGWQWDAGRDELYLTGEAMRIIGADGTRSGIAGLLDTLLPDDARRLRWALDRAIASDHGVHLEVQGMHRDGKPFWIRLMGERQAGAPFNAQLTGTLQDITAPKQAEEALRLQARTDPMTGLLNRDAGLGDLEQWMAAGSFARVAVLYIDLDRFKVVNDVLGHAAGDRLLASAARRLMRAVGGEGHVVRFGGDEFLVICTFQDDASRPARLAQAILDNFSENFRVDGEEFSITASIGIAQAPEHGERPQQLIQSADVAMYDSKRRGRNAWQVFSTELAEQQTERLQLETHLRRAVDNDEFELVYQPQVDLASGRTVAAEALIRWRNRTLGEMPPDRFIQHAETTGDIVEIGNWALHEACRQLRRWRADGLQLDRVAVNVSYRQFLGEDLIRNVRSALAAAHLPGSALELEFTERVLIEDEPDTLRTFAELRDMGVVLTIDDFGEGYSALNYLRRLPIHGLKLSQLFVQGVPDIHSDVAVCQAVAGIARSLGLELIAEGIETEAQRTFMLRLGLGVGQGFLFQRGVPAGQLRQHYAAPINVMS